MPVPFSSHPRRLVQRPDGESCLVLIRRYTLMKPSWWSWGEPSELEWAWRRGHGDRRWAVEVYFGIRQEPLKTPERQADQAWVVEGRKSAAELAEVVVEALNTGADLPRGGVPAARRELDPGSRTLGAWRRLEPHHRGVIARRAIIELMACVALGWLIGGVPIAIGLAVALVPLTAWLQVQSLNGWPIRSRRPVAGDKGDF